MKPQPSKYSCRNTTRNQNVGRWNEQEMTERQRAIEAANNCPDEIKNKNIKYDLKR